MRTHRDLEILGLALLVITASILFRIDGESVSLQNRVHLPELCLIKATTGIDCPSCGMTRSFLATARADFQSAFTYNPVGVPLFMLVLLQIPFRTMRLCSKRFADRTDKWDGKVHLVIILSLVFMLLVVAVPRFFV